MEQRCLPKDRLNCLLISGAFVVFFPSGVFLYWGNLAVYVDSYIVRNSTDYGRQFSSPWIISTFLICNNLGITCGRLLSSHIGRRQTCLLAIFLFNAGLFLSYIAIRHSLTAICTSFGLLTGLGSGLLYSSVIADVIDCNHVTNIAFLMQISTTGYNIGAVVTNQYITLYINPSNEEVDTEINSVSYFSEDSILEAVPRAFLTLAVYTLAIHVLGFVMMQAFFFSRHNKNKSGWRCDNEETSEELLQNNTESEDEEYSLDSDTATSISNDNDDCDLHNPGNGERKRMLTKAHPPNILSLGIDECLEKYNNQNECYHYCCEDSVTPITNTCRQLESNKAIKLTNEDNEDNQGHSFTIDTINCGTESESNYSVMTGDYHKLCKSEETVLETTQPLIINEKSKDIPGTKSKQALETNNVSPGRLFCSKTVYIILSVIMAKHLAFNLLSNYYKTLGEYYIHDDQFLAMLGSLLSLISIPVKPIVGLVVDTYGVRNPTILSLLALCINSLVYPFTPKVNKWMFLISSLLLEMSICTVNACCSLLTLLILGKKYFTTNYGLLASVTILVDILNPLLIQTMLMHYGWIALFSGASIAIFVASIISLIFMPAK